LEKKTKNTKVETEEKERTEKKNREFVKVKYRLKGFSKKRKKVLKMKEEKKDRQVKKTGEGPKGGKKAQFF